MRASFFGSCGFVVSPDVRVIQKNHSERHSALFLNPFEQAFLYAEFRPEDEKLCRHATMDPVQWRYSVISRYSRCARKSLLSYVAGHGAASCTLGELSQAEAPRSPMSRP